MIKIFTDPCCNLSGEMLNELDVELFSYYGNYGDKRFKLTTDYDVYSQAEQFELLESWDFSFDRPNLGEWLLMVEPWVSKGYDILYVSMTQKVTGSGTTLSLIREELSKKYSQNIITYDTKCCSWGEAYILKEACLLRDRGKSIEEIVNCLDSMSHKIQNWYLPENGKAWKRAKRGEIGELESEINFTLITCDESGVLRPYMEFKNRKQGIDYISKFFEGSEVYVSFTEDVPDEDKDYLISLIPKENCHLSELCSPPCTTACLGRNSIEIAIISNR